MTQDTMGRVVPYDRDRHEGFLVEAWVRTWSRSRAGVQLGVNDQSSARWWAFFENYKPLALLLLQTEHVVVAEDAAAPEVIWGWMACSPDREVVHDVVIKRELTKPAAGEEANEDGRQIVRMLCGDMLTKKLGHTGELASLRWLGMSPRSWHFDATYLARKLMDIIRSGKAAA